jgi:GGDEF domain-containing protein
MRDVNTEITAPENDKERDNVTGLPTVEVFLKRCDDLVQARGSDSAEPEPFAVHLLQIANIGDIVVEHGLPQAEAYLRGVSTRLYGLLTGDKILARIDGDVLGLLQSNLRHSGDARYLSRRACEVLQEPVVVDKMTIPVELRSTIVKFPEDAMTAKELLDAALIQLDEEQVKGQCT